MTVVDQELLAEPRQPRSWLAGFMGASAPAAWPAMRALRIGFTIALLAYLAYALFALGWSQLWAARPENWLFYALLPVAFLISPIADLAIYRRLWSTGPKLQLPVIVRKNVLNNVLIDLSGETYLALWARRNLPLPPGFLLHAMKDNLLLAGIAAWGVLLIGLMWLTASGQLLILFESGGALWIYPALVGLLAILCLTLFVSRQAIAALSRGQIAFTFGVHMVRVLSGHALMVLLWSLAVPSVPLVVWLNFLLVRILATRLGFLPSRDLIMLGAGLGVAAALGLPQASVAAMLMLIVASEHLCSLLVLSARDLMTAARALVNAFAKSKDEARDAVPSIVSSPQ